MVAAKLRDNSRDTHKVSFELARPEGSAAPPADLAAKLGHERGNLVKILIDSNSSACNKCELFSFART